MVSDGECDVVDYCVHCPNCPSVYGSNQACDIRFRSVVTLLMDDFAREKSLDYLFVAGDMYSESTDHDNISVTSDSLLFWSSDYRKTTRDGRCVLSNIRVPHVSTVTSTSLRSVPHYIVNLRSSPSGISQAIKFFSPW